MVGDTLVELLGPIADLLLPAIYASFMIGTAVLLALADRRPARRLWLVGLFSGLVVVTLVGAPLLPFVDMNKYADSTDEEFTYYEIRMVDAEGTELRYDTRAIPPVKGGTRHSRLGGLMVESYSDGERLEMARFLFDSAVEYRAEVEADEARRLERLQAPRYVDSEPWTREDLADVEPFRSIRIYEVTLVYEDDNTGIASRDERERLRIDPATGAIEEGGSS